MLRLVVWLIALWVQALRAVLRSRSDLVLENIALRQQITVLKRKEPRAQLDDRTRAFWVAMCKTWSGWAQRLIIVKPETVVKWHRDRVRRHWTRISHGKRGPGRPRIDIELRALIPTMARDNGWGAPRIHGELKKLGFVVSQATVSRHLPKKPPKPDALKRWMAFLRHHQDGIVGLRLWTSSSSRPLRCASCIVSS